MKSWFLHSTISSDEADRLVNHYRKKGYRVERMLNVDPSRWDVAVRTHERRYNPRTPRSMINKIWS